MEQGKLSYSSIVELYSVCLAKLRAQAAKVEADTELNRLTQARELELNYSKLTADLEIEKTKRLAAIEINEFREHVNAIGSETIQAIATSGPENQVKIILSCFIRVIHFYVCFRLNFFKLLVLNQH